MKVFTDSVLFAEKLIFPLQDWRGAEFSDQNASLPILVDRLFSGQSVYQNIADASDEWTHVFLVTEAPSSQFDLLIEFTRTHPNIPGGIVCLAGTGHGFHGQNERHWATLEGNIHLTAYLTPQRKVERFGVGFPILAAVSIVEAIDSIKGLEGKASIKWVNDVLCEEAKVAGFLVHTASMEDQVSSVVLGVGLNVEKTPELSPDAHVPKVASIREFVGESAELNQRKILAILLDRMSANYQLLLEGQWAQLLNVYRKRSLVVGREVRILSDPEDGKQEELGSGRVFSIGENLELWLDGEENPVKKGRLILID
jgi:BirA family biotin operon repressor/biotin-[acetyl-CoA-carboxylase] ligase